MAKKGIRNQLRYRALDEAGDVARAQLEPLREIFDQGTNNGHAYLDEFNDCNDCSDVQIPPDNGDIVYPTRPHRHSYD